MPERPNFIPVMIVAGERSGDMYGGRLASALTTRPPEFSLFGCGGDAMRQAGVETVVDSHQFAMVGITEVVSGLPRAWRAFNRLVEEARRRHPQLAILIDSPSLNMRLAAKLKRLSVPVLYFVSPQIWAWKKWRLRQLAARVDKMVCIFDFEEQIYRRAGVPAEYVGHPLVDTVKPHISREEFFAQAGLDPSIDTVAVLPGSREIEISYILPPVLRAVALLSERRRLQFILAVAPTLDAARIERHLRRNSAIRGPVRIMTHATYDVLAHSTLAVVASGTATIEAALLGRPMVVVYRVSPVTAFFARWMVDVPFFSMVNILAGEEAVPELIQSGFTASRLTAEVERILDHPEVQLEMSRKFQALRSRLGNGGAIDRVAGITAAMIQGREQVTGKSEVRN
jgi:lipid-A-disaccharide synthase